MVDRRPVRREVRPSHSGQAIGLTASAQILTPNNTRTLTIAPSELQREAWDFYHSLGELQYAVSGWLANAVSRVKIYVAKKSPGEDPTPVTDGPVLDLVSDFLDGPGNVSAMMHKFAVHLSIPGESYLVGEDTVYGRTWTVFSSDEIRIKSRGRLPQQNFSDPSIEVVIYEVQELEGQWRELNVESIVVRIWRPDDQYAFKAFSAAMAALPIMREIDYYNRFIVAVLLSRVALNGFLLIPSEVTFPVKKEYAKFADPFVAELIDISSKAIANPGTAAAALPMPLKVPAEYIEKFKHLTVDTQMGEKVLEDREKALRRLAASMNMPAEVLTGVADMNHWGQWQLEESGIKIHITPLVEELICAGLTRGLLTPMMVAAGLPLRESDGSTYLFWYDVSDLAQSPDQSGTAKDLFDRGEMSGSELRDASGFDPELEVSMDDFKVIALKKIALSGGSDSMRALAILTGDESLNPPPEPTPIVPEASNPNDTTNQPQGAEESPGDVQKGVPEQSPRPVMPGR